jgi:amidase
MARTVLDLAKLLTIQAGRDSRAPLSIAEASRSFVPEPGAGLRDVRIGWLADLGGYLPIEGGILDVCERALKRLAGGGAAVEPLSLGFDPARLWDAWLVWRRALVAPIVAAVLGRPGARDSIKPEALWEHDQAQELRFTDFMQAAAVRSAFYAHMLGLFERFDVLALPVSQVWPFDVKWHWPKTVAGRAMDTYHRWMEVTLYATFAGLPAMSVPAGFDAADRLPMGLQLVGRPQGDAELLAAAAAYEDMIPDLMERRPPL